MLITRQNRLLPILAGIVVLMLVLVLAKSCSDEDTAGSTLEDVPTASRPDADTPADTIETLTANVAAMTAELERLRQVNAKVYTDNAALARHKEEIEEQLVTKIDEVLLARESHEPEVEQAALLALSQRVDALAEALRPADVSLTDYEMPIGLGLQGSDSSAELIWVDPMDHTDTGLGDELLQRVGNVGKESAYARQGRASEGASDAKRDAEPVPVYTVPRNATLMGATAMTALLGRVPVRGQVRDPMPFKVITGADNLAANGLSVPGVEGMIWSGTAIGDWTLSCITGRLESVTFVFDDGRIRTVSSDDREQRDGDRSLGWISDAHGIPCISGERKSNAAAFLTQRFGVKLMEAAAQAAAAAETTTVIRDSGAVSSSVAGDTGDYIMGKTLADASSEVAAWLQDRQAQNFDAVFVPAGRELAIHVDRELAIDRDPNGRRLTHETRSTSSHSHPLD